MTLEFAAPSSAAKSASCSPVPPTEAQAAQADGAGPQDAAPGAAFPPRLAAALARRGYTELTAVQRAVLEAEAEGEGRDLQISSQTGSGKTVALGFVLAHAFEAERAGKGPEALIIVPTRELATQVCEELAWLFADLRDVTLASVTGGTPLHRDRALLARRPRVLVGTPGRLLDHVKSGVVDLSGVRELVLDEADQMLDMGFREELEGILDTTPEERRTHLVSATFPDGIRRLAARYQREPVTIEGTRLGDANEDIEHAGHVVHPRERYDALVNLLLLADGERTLVFVDRRSDTLELATKLESDGFAALPLSGELAQSQRERTLAAFRDGRATVLVATDVAARGLDVPDVATVIHTSPPMDSQVYTHRSGRTGRAGKRGKSLLFASPNRRRKAIRLLADAGIDLRWHPLPTAKDVRVELARRARAAVLESVEAALAAGASAEHLAQAEELLKERDAAPVVAALLARLEPESRAEPRDLSQAPPENSPWGQARARGGDRPYGRGGDRGGDRSGGRYNDRGPARFGDRGPAPRAGNQGAVRFFVNWGRNQGADPRRVLAAVCRRGQVDGSDIGSIAVHPNATTFDVSGDVAEKFEHLAGRRDPRDPQVRIRRDRGPQ